MLKLLIYVWANIIPYLQIPNIILLGVRNEQLASTTARSNFKSMKFSYSQSTFYHEEILNLAFFDSKVYLAL